MVEGMCWCKGLLVTEAREGSSLLLLTTVVKSWFNNHIATGLQCQFAIGVPGAAVFQQQSLSPCQARRLVPLALSHQIVQQQQLKRDTCKHPRTITAAHQQAAACKQIQAGAGTQAAAANAAQHIRVRGTTYQC